MSPPATMIGMTLAWIGVGRAHPSAPIARIVSGWRENSSNEIGEPAGPASTRGLSGSVMLIQIASSCNPAGAGPRLSPLKLVPASARVSPGPTRHEQACDTPRGMPPASPAERMYDDRRSVTSAAAAVKSRSLVPSGICGRRRCRHPPAELDGPPPYETLEVFEEHVGIEALLDQALGKLFLAKCRHHRMVLPVPVGPERRPH